ncbi:MAG: thiamine-phosphate kinase [bacterium]
MSDDDPPPGQWSEHEFLASLCRRLAPASPDPSLEVPPGDDAAVLAFGDARLVATTDALVEGVHFRTGWLTPAELGLRAAIANLSDLAAMGASPVALLLALVVPAGFAERDVEELAMAVSDEARRVGARLVGGNLSRGPSLAITITALGRLDGPALRRDGAGADDLLVVTGTLGDAAAAVAAWEAGQDPIAPLRDRFARPRARLAAGEVLASAGATSAIDISDGLLADLGQLCRASGVGATIEREALPRSPQVEALDTDGRDFAANGGEDYELLVTLPRSLDTQLAKLAGACGTSLSVIGHTTDPASGLVIRAKDGTVHPLARDGFDHFRSALK